MINFWMIVNSWSMTAKELIIRQKKVTSIIIGIDGKNDILEELTMPGKRERRIEKL